MRYFLAHNGVDIFCPGELEDGAEVVTGQPYLEYFYTKEELASKLKEYNKNISDYIEIF